MKILLLGYKGSKVYDYLNENHDTHQMLDKLTVDVASQFDYLISYRYRHIIKQDVLDNVRNPIINLHMAFLPWNKGADPNFWSWHDDTLKGISIHQIDSGIDTGDILIQKEIYLDDSHTLRSSYNKLDSELENLFIDNFDKILNKEIKPICQTKSGSIHYKKDLTSKQAILRSGWNTPVVDIKQNKDD
tara:strand:- start:4079 stop:4642 length:564 start_codon:yes stop_codon:yes gene_type:complete